MDRLEEIEQRAAWLDFARKPYQYVVHQRIPWWYTQAITVNTLRDLVTEDIPWLLARIRELEGA